MSKVTLHHFSSSVPGVLEPRFYRDAPWFGHVSNYNKPWGFWLSDESGEDGWSHWCASEAYGIGEVRTAYLLDTANVLHLKDFDDLWGFTVRYGMETSYSHGAIRHFAIDWARVQSDYAGILITPYVWSARLDIGWYYGWDVASACIWDPSCLSRVDEQVLT